MCNSKAQGHKALAVLPAEEGEFEFVVSDFKNGSEESVAAYRHPVISWLVWDTGETVALCIVESIDHIVEVKMSCCLARSDGYRYYSVNQGEIRRSSIRRLVPDSINVSKLPSLPQDGWPYA